MNIEHRTSNIEHRMDNQKKLTFGDEGCELRVGEKMNIEHRTSNIEWKTGKTLTFGGEGCGLGFSIDNQQSTIINYKGYFYGKMAK